MCSVDGQLPRFDQYLHMNWPAKAAKNFFYAELVRRSRAR